MCDLWIQTIQKKEQNEIVLPEPSMPPTGQRRQLGVWLFVFVVALSFLLLFHSRVC